MLHFHRKPGPTLKQTVLQSIQSIHDGIDIQSIRSEYCYNVEILPDIQQLSSIQMNKLMWLLRETFEPLNLSSSSFLVSEVGSLNIIEVGPRLAFTTAWCSNCMSMLQACGINEVKRIERSRRFTFNCKGNHSINSEQRTQIIALLHDRMTECEYTTPLTSFAIGLSNIQPITIVPLLSEGKKSLESINQSLGLGFDEWDIDFYYDMFIHQLQRNPTDVECFDLGQSNSEHSRHWFFGGKMIIDGIEKPKTLFQMVKSTLPPQSNSVIAFHDNSSAIEGFEVDTLIPQSPLRASVMEPQRITLHPILTAETHNFPSGVAPFPGAETGTGGRLRDVQATGRGAYTLAGICGYCVGNLHIPDSPLPWEASSSTMAYASNLALPLEIEVESSNGASDYGNKYGEPVVTGFTRSFGQRLSALNESNQIISERYEWIKPIMFTAGVGLLDSRHCSKNPPEVGMIVCKVGGPAYRIGMGGGAASSRVQGSADTALLDFNAVQRGDAEMENRMNRVIRGCVELGGANPIVSIHDQGAGGNGNVLKEIVDPLGARIEIRNIPLGDPTLSVMEIWGAEYQENNAILVKPEDLATVLALGSRENCPVSPVGMVSGDGRVVVTDSLHDNTPFDLPLSLVLGKMPQKTFSFVTPKNILSPLTLPIGTTVAIALDRVLRLLDVGSKRFLTNKVDRSVTGLVAQQSCVGPLHTPLSDVAVLAQSHFGITGMAVAVGEQPIKGLVDNKAQARMTVGEALSNLVFAKITSLKDVKASGNWMWAAKLPGEGAKMYECCEALTDALLRLGPCIDGGKDSLSMAAKVEGGELVKAPGEVTLTCYAACPDITLTITPDFKYPDIGVILYVNLSPSLAVMRLGGTALSTVFEQIGDEVSDMNNIETFRTCFECIQELLTQKLLVSGHDRSDGGLIVTLLEMCFAGNCGMDVALPIAMTDPSKGGIASEISALFAEELGFVFEVLPQHVHRVQDYFQSRGVDAYCIGKVTSEKKIQIRCIHEEESIVVLDQSMTALRDVWESTSFALERRQSHHECVQEEQSSLAIRTGSAYKLTFDVHRTDDRLLRAPSGTKPRMAVIRQEGSNGDREMSSAFYSAGFEVWDVNMYDLLTGNITLEMFRGIAFCGGFSYADVNDSAKGWAGVIQFNPNLLKQFEAFRDRSNTFSLSVCNGCQLAALLGWVPFPGGKIRLAGGNESIAFDDSLQPRFVHNKSGRYECRWATVKILPSPSVLLHNMVGSCLGIWVGHGEGRLHLPDPSHLDLIQEEGLAPLRFVHDNNQITEAYPCNPNGSMEGIAALCSQDGRHLALMPHPERCFLTWQCPYLPNEWKASLEMSPWIQLFQNARIFCENN